MTTRRCWSKSWIGSAPAATSWTPTRRARHYRDFWFPKLLDRKIRPQWLAAGGTTLGQRLNAKTRKLIKEYKPVPLAPEKKQKVQEILAGVWH